MQLTQLFTAATLAWTASAMLVTPDTTDLTTDAAIAMLAWDGTGKVETDALAFRFPCDGCAVALGEVQEGGRTWDVSHNRMTDLLLVFTQKDGKLLLGRSAIYPPQTSIFLPLTRQVKALVDGQDNDDFAISDDELYMATRYDVGPKRPVDGQPGAFVTDYLLEVLAIDDKIVHVPSVSFSVVETADSITVSDVAIVPTVTTVADAMCDTVLCRIRAQLAAKMMAAMEAVKSAAGKAKAGCMRMMGMHGKHGKHGDHKHAHHEQQQQQQHHQADASSVEVDKDAVAPAYVLDRLRGGPNKFQGPGHRHPHGGMRRPCGRHGFAARVARGVVFFLKSFVLPILAGVTIGMLVGLLAAVFVHVVPAIGRCLCGSKGGDEEERGAYVSVVEGYGEKVVVVAEEEEDDELPRYEPADAKTMPPAYVDEKTETEN